MRRRLTSYVHAGGSVWPAGATHPGTIPDAVAALITNPNAWEPDPEAEQEPPSGGLVAGPGAVDTDAIPAPLTGPDFVMREQPAETPPRAKRKYTRRTPRGTTTS